MFPVYQEDTNSFVVEHKVYGWMESPRGGLKSAILIFLRQFNRHASKEGAMDEPVWIPGSPEFFMLPV